MQFWISRTLNLGILVVLGPTYYNFRLRTTQFRIRQEEEVVKQLFKVNQPKIPLSVPVNRFLLFRIG